jgi:DNA-sulfur modification-associated
MAITLKLGGIRLDENRISTVVPIQLLMEHSISGMAFEPKEKTGELYEHLDERVRELSPARGSIQRAFFARAMRDVRVTDPVTGEKHTDREPTGWSPTAKHRNATGELLNYIQGPFLDNPPLTATLPAFILYCPELLEGAPREDFNAHMGGEFYGYDIDPGRKFMLADGESRHLSIELALSPSSKLPGNRREKLKNKLVTVEIIHGIPPEDMGQMFADLNGKGVTLTKNAVQALDVRDPWARATKEIFRELDVPLMSSGRQITAVAMAENKHLLIGQAITMVRAVGLGSFSKAVSASAYDDQLKTPEGYAKVVRAGVTWFGIILDHFGMPKINGARSAEIFTDPDRVLRAMPVKVALGVMGNAWVDVSLPKQAEYQAALKDIDWRVSLRWQGVAGKVSQAVEKKKIDGKTVREPIKGEYRLAASGAKEIGSAAVRALTSPESVAGKRIRGLTADNAQVEDDAA